MYCVLQYVIKYIIVERITPKIVRIKCNSERYVYLPLLSAPPLPARTGTHCRLRDDVDKPGCT